MTIRSVDAIVLDIPYEMFGPKPLFCGHPRKMNILLVRVQTEDGLVGWGEAFGYTIWPAARAAIESLVAPLAIGKDEADIPSVMGPMERQFHLLGRTGALTYALSGLDIALWDLAGKRAGKPLSALLGGARHRRLPTYASLIRYGDSALVAENALRAKQRGHRLVKLHETEVAHVRAAREALGPDVPLTMDTNCPWTVEQAIAVARELQPYGLAWFEEPVWPPEDFAGLAAVRKAAGIPIAAGENAMSAKHFEQLFDAQAVDIAQPSITKIGGVSEFMKIVELARRHGAQLVPHCPYFGPGLLATLHIAATFEHETLIEHSLADLGASPLGKAVIPENGFLDIPDGPGLGVDPDPAVLEQCRVG
ncbi:mandelate racemase/muconate lactonizing enzyme family protein [Pigmentiphaga soli]|uniref:Mandelate racemase/muconate lactonizing enzyme family protein n=1 Tax=Pigmentiphaga soli TaxID=1007095 RepID=A0ABP8HEX2_9BURK